MKKRKLPSFKRSGGGPASTCGLPHFVRVKRSRCVVALVLKSKFSDVVVDSVIGLSPHSSRCVRFTSDPSTFSPISSAPLLRHLPGKTGPCRVQPEDRDGFFVVARHRV